MELHNFLSVFERERESVRAECERLLRQKEKNYKFAFLWKNLSREEQFLVLERLTREGIFSPLVVEILREFEGEIV